RQVQVGLHGGVRKAALAGHTVRHQRVPRGAGTRAEAQRDRVGGGTALDDALVVEERRTDRRTHRLDVEVAGADLGALVLVVQITRIPVPVALGYLEGAGKFTVEAEGGQVVLYL